MEVQVREFVGVGAVVDFGRIERGLHGLSRAGDILHEQVSLGVRELEELVDVVAVGDDAAAAISLLLEKVERGDLHRTDFDHEIVKTLVLAAVLAVGEFGHGEKVDDESGGRRARVRGDQQQSAEFGRMGK